MSSPGASVWDSVEIGDATAPYVYEVTADKIADFSRAARYENLVYTNQPAARETGLPGIIAPPAMVFVYAPGRLSGLMEARGVNHPEQASGGAATVKVLLNSQGAMVGPGDVITSVTSVQEKLRTGTGRFLTVRVTGHNQQGESVADYSWTYLFP